MNPIRLLASIRVRLQGTLVRYRERLEQPGPFSGIRRILSRLMRLDHLLGLLLVLFALSGFTQLLVREQVTRRPAVLHVTEKGMRKPSGRIKAGKRALILRWDYGWYRIRTRDGRSGSVPAAAFDIDNPWLEIFIPAVFSLNHKPNRIPFKKESHTVRYTERKGGHLRGSGEYYWRLTLPFLALLAAAFVLGFSRFLLKTAASILFFSLLLVYTLFAASEENKQNYSYVSYFKQVSLRIPYTHKGNVFVPNTTWLLRVKAFLGNRETVMLSSRATPKNIRDAYLVTDAKGYTPGWALRRARLVYANGPARLYRIPGP